MKKRTINAFTLVEMLIVIVIIGILIAALMPRMQAAQGRARDVSRKTALSQIQSAIVTSQGDKGQWPGVCDNDENTPIPKCAEGCESATEGVDVECIREELTAAGMNSVPTDPLAATLVKGLGNLGDNPNKGQYRYMVTKRNGAKQGGFILMAKTEVEGGSNYVVCGDDSGLSSDTDIADPDSFQLCQSIKKWKEGDGETDKCKKPTKDNNGACVYEKDDELRYVVVY